MAYRPAFQKQADGSQCGWENCNPTSHAMAVDRDWLGARKGGPVAIRNRIDLFCPGTSMSQNLTAVKALYATAMDARYDVPWSTFLDGLVSGRGAVVTILYSVVHGTPFDACRTFDGRHAIYVNERRWNATLGRYEALVFDPLADGRYSWIPKGPQWWPMSLLEKAMLASYTTDGSGNVESSFTRNTATGPKKALYAKDSVTGTVPHFRPTAGVDKPPVDVIRIGDLVRVVQTLAGGAWTINGKKGSVWYRIDTVDGQSVDLRYGVPVVYAAQGWFEGPGGAL